MKRNSYQYQQLAADKVVRREVGNLHAERFRRFGPSDPWDQLPLVRLMTLVVNIEAVRGILTRLPPKCLRDNQLSGVSKNLSMWFKMNSEAIILIMMEYHTDSG